MKDQEQHIDQEQSEQSHQEDGGFEIEGVNSTGYKSSSVDTGSAGVGDESNTNPYLPGKVQRNAEKSLGIELSNINVYKDSARAKEQGAAAFTEGNTIHFAPGKFNPYSKDGQKLLNHELIHIAQQREGLQIGSGGNISRAESQAERLEEYLAEGKPITEKLEPVPFNTIQYKPDPTNPVELGELQMSYIVYVAKSGAKSEFEKIIANQIYLNDTITVNLTKKNGYYYIGKRVSVGVKLKDFVGTLLENEIGEDPIKFAQREYLIHQYIYNNWLISPEGGGYALNQLAATDSDAAVKARQLDLKNQLIKILNSGTSRRVHDEYIHSYKRSYYESGYGKDSNDKQSGEFTSREKAHQISDTIIQHMPFEKKKDYIELIYHSIPATKQPAGLSYQYFYFDPITNRYLESEIMPLGTFNPHMKIASDKLFTVDGPNIKMDWTYHLIGDDYSSPQSYGISFTIQADAYKEIEIVFGNEIGESTKFAVRSNQLVTISEGYATLSEEYRNKAYVGGKETPDVLNRRKFKEKLLYQNKRDRNAAHRLDQLHEYYGDDATYVKVQSDINSFFTGQNVELLKFLSPSEQLGLVTLIDKLDTENPSLIELKDIFSHFQTLLGFQLVGWQEAADQESFIKALVHLRLERKTESKEVYVEPDPTQEKRDNLTTTTYLYEEVVRPFKIETELQLIDLFIKYVKNPNEAIGELKGSLNEVFNDKSQNIRFSAANSLDELDELKKAMTSVDDEEKLKYLQDVLSKQSIYLTNNSWIERLSSSETLDNFKEVLNEKPESEVKIFFDHILDGSLLSSVEKKQGELEKMTNIISGSASVKRPLERMNNGIKDFLIDHNLAASQLIKVNAVFYPGEESIIKDAKYSVPIPINLYAYEEEGNWHNVVFLDNGETITSKSYYSNSDSSELVTHGYLKYLDQEKVLGQGVLYYHDSKKFTDDESGNYTSNTISSYEFTSQGSIWDTASNVISGVTFVASMLAGPAGWMRNLLMIGALTSVITVGISKYNKSRFEDLDGKDAADIIFAAGGVTFDVIRAAKLVKAMKTAQDNPALKQALLNSIQEEGKVEFWFKIADMGYNGYDVWKAIEANGIGFNELYSILQMGFAVKSTLNSVGVGVKKLDRHVDLLNKSISNEYNIDQSLNYSRILNEDPDLVLPANKEFHNMLGKLSHAEMEVLGENLKTIRDSGDMDTYLALLTKFGSGTKAEILNQYILVVKLSNRKISANEISIDDVKKIMNPNGQKINGEDFVDPSKIKDTKNQLDENTKKKDGIIKESATLDEVQLDSEKRVIELQEKLDKHKENTNAAKKKYSDKKTDFENIYKDVENSKNRLEQLNISNKNKSQKIEELGEKHIAKKGELGDLNKKHSQQKEELGDVETLINNDKKKIGKHDETQEAITKRKNGLTEELGLTKEEISKLDRRIKKNEKVLSDLEGNMGSISTSIDQKVKSISDIERKNERFDSGIENAKAGIKEMNKKISDFDRNNIGTLTQKQFENKKRLVEDRKAFRLKLKQMRERKNTDKPLVAERNKQKKEFQEQVENLESDFSNAFDEWDTKNKELKNPLENDRSNKTKLEDNVGTIEENIGHEQTNYDEVGELKKEINERISTNEKIQKEKKIEFDETDALKTKLENQLIAVDENIELLKSDLLRDQNKLNDLTRELLADFNTKKIAEEEFLIARDALNKTKKSVDRKELYREMDYENEAIALSLAEQNKLLLDNESINKDSQNMELERSNALEAYKAEFGMKLLKRESNKDGWKKSLAVRIKDSFFRLKRHQVKRLISLAENSFVEIDSNAGFESGIDDALEIIEKELNELYRHKNDLNNSIKSKISQKVRDKRESLKLELERSVMLIDDVNFEINVLKTEEILNGGSKKISDQLKMKNDILEGHQTNSVWIKEELSSIDKIMFSIDNLDAMGLNQFFAEGNKDEYPIEVWNELRNSFGKEELEILKEIKEIDEFIELLKPMRDFVQVNYKSAIRHDTKWTPKITD